MTRNRKSSRVFRSLLDFHSRASQDLFDRGQSLEDAVRTAVVTHESDAPGLALELAQSAADLDAELGQEPLAARGFIHAIGTPHGVELRKLVAFTGQVFETERSQAGTQCLGIANVPRESSFEPFFQDEP